MGDARRDYTFGSSSALPLPFAVRLILPLPALNRARLAPFSGARNLMWQFENGFHLAIEVLTPRLI